MKEYNKPLLVKEELNIVDVIAASFDDKDGLDIKGDILDLFGM